MPKNILKKSNIKKHNKLYVFLIILVFLLLFYFINSRIDLFSLADIEVIKKFILSFGVLSPVVYMLIMATAIVISPVPSLPLDAAAGVIWGPWLGTLYSVIGALIGAIAAFTIARVFGRGVVQRILNKDIVFCDRCSERYLTWFVFVLRLFPIFQFDIVSYGAGLTNMRLKHFATASFFGMIPATFLFAYFGETLFLGNIFSIVITLIIIIAIFIVPVLIKRHNLFNLRDKL
jgi:uncharacterized membrane protein YdjX (TVP38/TMEM64 family)